MAGNILIIDDEEQLRKLLSRIISLEGFKTEEAGTIKAAWKLLDKGPDVVLCDVKLPDGNGVVFYLEEAKRGLDVSPSSSYRPRLLGGASRVRTILHPCPPQITFTSWKAIGAAPHSSIRYVTLSNPFI